MRFGPYFALLNNEFEHKGGKIVTEAYLDPKGVPTGPGGRITNLDGSSVVMGQTWTEQEALELYAAGKQDFAEDVFHLLKPERRSQLKQHQFDAMGVLAWNIGIGAFAGSSALELINEGRFEEGFSKFLLWRRMTLEGGKSGPDGKPARGPDNKPLPEGVDWFRASRGIYRRSISAALLGMGHNWTNAAGLNKIVLQSYPIFVEKENRWVDRITNEMDWKEVLADAKDDPLPVIQGDPDPELFDLEPTKMEVLQYESAKAVGADETLEEFVAMRRGLVKPMPVGKKPLSINTKQPEEVPYGIDPKAGLQPKEEAERVQRYVKKKQGEEMKRVGQGLTVATGIAASANELAGETNSFLSSLGTIGLVLLGLALGVGLIYWAVGYIREKHNERKEVEAEINAVQGIY